MERETLVLLSLDDADTEVDPVPALECALARAWGVLCIEQVRYAASRMTLADQAALASAARAVADIQNTIRRHQGLSPIRRVAGEADAYS